MDALRAGPDADAAGQPDFDSVVVDRPKKTWFVNVHPEWRVDVYVLLPDETERRFTHVLTPKVARQFPQICRRVTLAPYADRENAVYLWPLLLEDSSGNLSDYNQSALECVRQGAGQWCRYEADQKHQRYNVRWAEEQIAPPEWPPEGMPRLVKAGFLGSIISDPRSEFLRRRIGRPTPPLSAATTHLR